MKRIIKYVSVCLLVVFSFYYTNMVSKLYINNSELMKKITSEEGSYEVLFVNAQIDNQYIIPGINGVKVDRLETYYSMKAKSTFDNSLFVLKEISPEESYYNHKDLIIKKGNSIKNSVSLVVKDNDIVINYLLSKRIVFNRLVDINSVKAKADYLQINNDFLHYEQVEKILDKNKGNSNICIINNNNYDFCESYGKYLVMAKNADNEVSSGDIIYIDDNYDLSKLRLLLKSIEFQNLSLSYLNYLISESR